MIIFMNTSINKRPNRLWPIYYVALTQVRCFASFLNYDLFHVNIVSDPSCRCGANREDSYHFFFDCSHYAKMRYTLFRNLSWLPNDYVCLYTYEFWLFLCKIVRSSVILLLPLSADLKLLTSGNPILSNEQNEIIFKHVFEYIKRSERFLV
jgi:hypothetical protein